MLHNSYQIAGGEDVSTQAEIRLLRENNVEVDTYSVSNRDIGKTNKLRLALNTIWSFVHYKKILNKLRQGNYDIVHVQNFFPLLSPSVFHACRKANVKVVMSVRNYRLICPNALLFVDGSICSLCVGKKIPLPAIRKKCYRNSKAASATVVSMLTVHNYLRTWSHELDGMICVSEFVREQMRSGGFAEEQLHVKYNFVATECPPNFGSGDYYIYVGRLSVEKGLDILLDEFAGNDRKLVIIGDGPLREEVRQASLRNTNITYLGKLPLTETYGYLARAKALIFPSKWHEPFGRTIVEAFAHGTPVIGSALGGIRELIRSDYNGYLFDPFKKEALAGAITSFENAPSMETLRQNSYKTYSGEFLPAANIETLLSIYNKIVAQ